MEQLRIHNEIDFQKILEKRNNANGFANDIGIEIIEVEEGYAKGEIQIEEKHLNPGNSVHGGCIFTLADTVGGCAAWTRGSYVATASSNINYLNAAIDCKKIVAIAREIKAGKKLLVYEVDIFDEIGRAHV